MWFQPGDSRQKTQCAIEALAQFGVNCVESLGAVPKARAGAVVQAKRGSVPDLAERECASGYIEL